MCTNMSVEDVIKTPHFRQDRGEENSSTVISSESRGWFKSESF